MALFGKNDNQASMSKQKAAAGIPPGQVNIIGQGTTIEGTLSARSDVRISGRLVGKLRVDGKTVITPEGMVEGEIESTQADLAGHIQGEVAIKEILVLKNTAVVEGNIRTAKLVIEDGAVFSGKCDMSSAGKGAPAPPADRPSARHSESRQPEGGAVAS
jgi:cytoskeletal protein CcmA (bactofilin family)